MTAYMRAPNANLGGENRGSVNAIGKVKEAREAVAALFNCQPEEVLLNTDKCS